jgi:DNA primase
MDAVEDIKSRLSIEDVISQYVELKRAGRNFKGLSPFSSERTPSFMVSPEKQIWHDFSSGKGGNMFSFVMEMEGLDFRGALELLARKVGIDLDQYRTSGSRSNTKEKERLYEALELAAHFYQQQFIKSQKAIDYVSKKRQFTSKTTLEWRLGYSPNTGTALADYLHKKGFSDKEIKGAGLSAQRSRGVGDMFRGRLMIPLQDPQGRVIGFTARLLEDEPNAPKYINTPQTLLYDKSRHVYGLHLAKESIRKTKFVVIAEGNLDVISSHQAGVQQVVATAGTALTEQHLKALSRFTDDIRLSFDADKAGLNATERAIPIASKVGVSLSIITIPSGKDPDELIKQSPGIWEEVITKSQYALDWLIDRYQKQLDLSTAKGKKEFSDILMPTVQRLSDSVEKEHYIEHVSKILNVSRDALLTKMKPEATTPRLRSKVQKDSFDKDEADYRKLEDRFLSLVLLEPKLREMAGPIRPDMLIEDKAREVLMYIQANGGPTGEKGLPEALRPLEDYVKMLAFLKEEFYKDIDLVELRSEGELLRSKLIERYVKIQKPLLDRAIAQILENESPDSPEFARLHQKITKLNLLRKQYTKG